MGLLRIGVAVVLLAGCKGGDSARADDEAVTSPEDAKALAEQAKKLQGAIEELSKLVEDPKYDAARDRQLLALHERLEVRSYRIGRVRDDDAVGRLVDLYATAVEIGNLIETHVKQSKLDTVALAAKTDAPRLGIVASADPDFGARLVELGPPACAGKLAPKGTCPDDQPQTGVAYRASIGTPWIIGELATAGDAIPAKQVVRLVPTQVLDTLAKGTDASVAEILYKQRIGALKKRLEPARKSAGRAVSAFESLASKR